MSSITENSTFLSPMEPGACALGLVNLHSGALSPMDSSLNPEKSLPMPGSNLTSFILLRIHLEIAHESPKVLIQNSL